MFTAIVFSFFSFFFASLTSSVSAFGVRTCSLKQQQQRRVAVAVAPPVPPPRHRRTSFFVPKTAGGGLVPLFAEEATTGEEVEIECIVEDDEWMRLAIQLTDAIFAEVKGLVVATLEEEDVKKLEDAGKKIEARVRSEVESIRNELPSKDEVDKVAGELVDEIESRVREVTGKKDYKLGDVTKEAQERLVNVVTTFANGKTTLDDLKAEIDKRVETRVVEAKDTAGYEYWKFKKEVEKRQDELLQQVLEPDEYRELKELSNRADEIVASAKGVVTSVFNKLRE